jgi:hypothetical protein
MAKTKFILGKFSFPVFFLQPTVHKSKSHFWAKISKFGYQKELEKFRVNKNQWVKD